MRSSRSVPEFAFCPPCSVGLGTLGLIAWLAGATTLRAETVVHGTLAGGEWTEAESPYHATADLQLAAGKTLVVDAGVEVRFDPGVSLVVRGALTVLGTEEKSVRFLRADSEQAWGGVAFRGSGSSGELEHLEMTGADAVAGETRIAFKVDDHAKVTLRSCWFHDFPEVAIDATGESELVVQDSLVEHSMEAIHTADTYTLIEGSTIRHVHDYADSIDLDYNAQTRSVVRNCLIEDNSDDDGIDLQGSNALIENVVIRGIAKGKGISIDLVCSPTIRNVLVVDSMWGLVVKDKSTPKFEQCTVTQCEKGLYVFEKSSGAGGGHLTGESMIVWNNTQNIEVDAKSTCALTYSLVGGGRPGEGNIDADPLFADPAAEDFRLLPGSPAIGTGKNGVNMGALPALELQGPVFIRGDANRDGALDISDPVTILLYLFKGTANPTCLDALDADDLVAVEITDAIYLLTFLFLGGPEPPAPYPAAGLDPTTADPLDCGAQDG